MNKQITTLYEHYKNTPKRLKIVCDWDEVIQACEPYALWFNKEEGYRYVLSFNKVPLSGIVIDYDSETVWTERIW